MMPDRFTIRVYGFLIDDAGRVLISHERIGNYAFTKFPGGGLEFGEGPLDCLVREFKEETGLDVEIGSLIYTTDFFVQSRIKPEEQVIGIYYLVKVKEIPDSDSCKINLEIMDTISNQYIMSQEWVSIDDFKTEMLTFEMDRRAWEVFMHSAFIKSSNV